MAKKGKSAKKRTERRERSKARESGELIDVNEELTDSEAAETSAPAVAEPSRPARERRAPKQAKKEEPGENAWTRLSSFFKEVIIEAKKINWPAREEATRSTMVVVVAIVFLAAFMGLWSFVFSQVAEKAFRVNTPIVQPMMPGDDIGQVGGEADDGATGETAGGVTENEPGGSETPD